MNKKTEMLLTSHKILQYGEEFKRRSEMLKSRKKHSKDKGEVMFIDSELKVLKALIEKTCEMIDDVNDHLEFK